MDCCRTALRLGGKEVTVTVRSPRGRERILNFDRRSVSSPNGGNLTWGRDGGDWYIGVDNREFYVVPEAAIYGG